MAGPLNSFSGKIDVAYAFSIFTQTGADRFAHLMAKGWKHFDAAANASQWRPASADP